MCCFNIYNIRFICLYMIYVVFSIVHTYCWIPLVCYFFTNTFLLNVAFCNPNWMPKVIAIIMLIHSGSWCQVICDKGLLLQHLPITINFTCLEHHLLVLPLHSLMLGKPCCRVLLFTSMMGFVLPLSDSLTRPFLTLAFLLC